MYSISLFISVPSCLPWQFFVIACGLLCVHSMEIYLDVDYSPERLNQQLNSAVLATVFTNAWTLIVFVSPFVFYINKPKRMRCGEN